MKIDASLESKLEANKVQTRESNLVLTLFQRNGSEEDQQKERYPLKTIQTSKEASTNNGRCAM